MKKNKMIFIGPAFLIFIMVLTSGCASLDKKAAFGTMSEALEPQLNMKFSDVPVPAGFKLLSKESYVFESSGIRAGVLSYRGKADVDRVVNFYKEQMGMFNWNLINIVEYDQHLLNFDRENETCVINLTSKGKAVNMVISLGPKSQGPVKKAKEKEPVK
ncbi:MAG: hypothetical protein JW788_02080 [Candidatus Omnitrophica bacterium]|nr:hypothetical protein [Candidatus Omnitrophota bacterium]